MTKRTMSMELRAIRTQMNESPPPPPTGASVREWFAGLALMNPELMKDLSPVERAVEAVRLADELIRALATPKLPSQESLAAPSAAEMTEWDKQVADNNEAKARQGRETVPDVKKVRCKTAAYEFGMLPPPNPAPTAPTSEHPVMSAEDHFRRASDHLRQPTTDESWLSLRVPAPAPTISLKKSPMPASSQYSSHRPTEND
jgi:hypothetical protein